jgi:hypothetical protein
MYATSSSSSSSSSPHTQPFVLLLSLSNTNTRTVWNVGTVCCAHFPAEVWDSWEPKVKDKLRMMTLLSLFTREREMSYATLMSTLRLSSTREVEQLVVRGMQAGAMVGKVDQLRQTVRVFDVYGRDVSQEGIYIYIYMYKHIMYQRDMHTFMPQSSLMRLNVHTHMCDMCICRTFILFEISPVMET